MKWLNRELQKQQLAKGIHNPSFNYAHLTTIQEASVLYAALQEEKQIIVIKENETKPEHSTHKWNPSSPT